MIKNITTIIALIFTIVTVHAAPFVQVIMTDFSMTDTPVNTKYLCGTNDYYPTLMRFESSFHFSGGVSTETQTGYTDPGPRYNHYCVDAKGWNSTQPNNGIEVIMCSDTSPATNVITGITVGMYPAMGWLSGWATNSCVANNVSRAVTSRTKINFLGGQAGHTYVYQYCVMVIPRTYDANCQIVDDGDASVEIVPVTYYCVNPETNVYIDVTPAADYDYFEYDIFDVEFLSEEAPHTEA